MQGISQSEFARRDGCHEKQVRRAVISGHLKPFPDGSLDPNQVGTAWRKRRRKTAGSSNIRSDETPEEAADRIVNVEGRAPYTKAEAERIKENYLAMLRQLEYERESGAVIEIEDVVKAVTAQYAKVRNKLLGIPSKVAPRAAVLRTAEEVKLLLDSEVVLALKELTLDGGGDIAIGDLRRSN